MCLFLLTLCEISSQTLWEGTKIIFTRPNNADGTLEENQDRITSNVWVARGSSKGLYNAAQESGYTSNAGDTSAPHPVDTRWADGRISDGIGNLTFTTWRNWSGQSGGNVGQEAVLHLVTDDIYIDIKILSWQSGGGGGFSYERSTEGASTANAIWTGVTNSDWEDSTNWDGGFVPVLDTEVTIPSGTPNSPIISTEADEIDDLIINAGATLTIGATGSITVDASMTQNGTFEINSDLTNSGSFILEGTYSGSNNVTYNRFVINDSWHYISPPLANIDEDDFAIQAGLESLGGSDLGLGSYSPASDSWSYYQGVTSSDILQSGKGYSINLLTNIPDNITFSGDILTSDVLILDEDRSGTGYVLFGNPYTCYVDSNALLGFSPSLVSETIWLWDSSANNGFGDYVTIVSSDNFDIAPGQGFFAQFPPSSSNINIALFSNSHRKHQSSDTFLRNSTRPEVNLQLTDGNYLKEISINYEDTSTTGFDNGYDGPLFLGAPINGVSNTVFSLYSRPVLDENGTDLSIQSLPTNDYESLVVPIGINASSGSTITFTADAMNLPAGIQVFIEDRAMGSFTQLDLTNAEYTTTLGSNLNGVGRFYLHTSSQTLGDNDVSSWEVKVFSIDKDTIRITGIGTGKQSDLILYSVLGTKITQVSFVGDMVNEITLPTTIETGIYIVKLLTPFGEVTKKLLLK